MVATIAEYLFNPMQVQPGVRHGRTALQAKRGCTLGWSDLNLFGLPPQLTLLVPDLINELLTKKGNKAKLVKIMEFSITFWKILQTVPGSSLQHMVLDKKCDGDGSISLFVSMY